MFRKKSEMKQTADLEFIADKGFLIEGEITSGHAMRVLRAKHKELGDCSIKYPDPTNQPFYTSDEKGDLFMPLIFKIQQALANDFNQSI